MYKSESWHKTKICKNMSPKHFYYLKETFTWMIYVFSINFDEFCHYMNIMYILFIK